MNEPGQAGCAGRRAAKATAFTLVGYSRPRPRECGRSPGGRQATIFIAAKFRVLPADADRWPDITGDFTGATRTEPGCLWFDWSRSLDDPNEYVLIEAFRDDAAGAAHVRSGHFKQAQQAQQTLPPYLAETPRIVNFSIAGNDWSVLGELAVPDRVSVCLPSAPSLYSAAI